MFQKHNGTLKPKKDTEMHRGLCWKSQTGEIDDGEFDRFAVENIHQ